MAVQVDRMLGLHLCVVPKSGLVDGTAAQPLNGVGSFARGAMTDGMGWSRDNLGKETYVTFVREIYLSLACYLRPSVLFCGQSVLTCSFYLLN